MKTIATILAAAWVGVLMGPAWAQETKQEAPVGLLDGMTPEQARDVLRKSVETRFAGERQQVAAEIEANLTLTAAQKAGAISLLEGKPANTQRDNIERICRAFAAIDAPFAAAYKLYQGGKFVEAAEAFRKIAQANDVNYFGAAKSYLLGDALYRSVLADLGGDVVKGAIDRKTVWDAADVWSELLENMPDRVSFAAAAALARADAMEKLGRGIKAMEAYVYLVKNFAVTLDDEQVKAIGARLDKLAEVYKDPMQYVSGAMGDVTERLAKTDSGQATQDRQKEIASVLLEVIRQLEEKPTSPPPPPPPPQPPVPPKPDDGTIAVKPTRTNRPPGIGLPKAPGDLSTTPDDRPNNRKPRQTECGIPEDRDFTQLPPRQRDALMAAAQKAISERCRDLVSDYHARMAQETAAPKGRRPMETESP